jgi:DNA repair protein RecN (Recombination protein N)
VAPAQKALAEASVCSARLAAARARTLAWQIGEVEKLAPKADEWEELHTSHSRLANAQALLDAAQGALQRWTATKATRCGSGRCKCCNNQEHLETDFKDPIEVLGLQPGAG